MVSVNLTQETLDLHWPRPPHYGTLWDLGHPDDEDFVARIGLPQVSGCLGVLLMGLHSATEWSIHRRPFANRVDSPLSINIAHGKYRVYINIHFTLTCQVEACAACGWPMSSGPEPLHPWVHIPLWYPKTHKNDTINDIEMSFCWYGA